MKELLYVTNWDEKKKIILRYEVQPDGTLKNGNLFFDMTLYLCARSGLYRMQLKVAGIRP